MESGGGGYLPAQPSPLRIHFCGWVASIFWNKWVHWRLRSNIHSTRLTSGVGALRKKHPCFQCMWCKSLGTCDHFLETLSVLGCQILLSSRKNLKIHFSIRRYVLLQQLCSSPLVFWSVRSTLKKLSFVKRMFPGEKQCLCTKTRIILTPWRDDVQPCDVQVKSLALKLAPTSKGWLESVLSWAHKSQPRIDVQIHLFYFSRKSISGKPWLIVRHQVITTIVLLKFTKQRAWAAMESTLWVKLRMWTCSLGFYGPSAHTTPFFHHACLVRTSSSVERLRPSSLHSFLKNPWHNERRKKIIQDDSWQSRVPKLPNKVMSPW